MVGLDVSSSLPNILIETIGGGHRGLGHVYRSVTLAKELLDLGCHVSVVTLGRESRDVVPDNMQGNSPRPDIVISDFPPSENDIGRYGTFTVDIVDEPEEATDESDISFSNFYDESEGFFGGLDWVILRREFQTRADYHVDGYIAVSLGGVDPKNQTGPIAKSLLTAGRSVVPVHGPSFSHSTPGAIHGVPIRSILASAAVAVVSGGQTLLECAALGIPSVVIPANDRELLRAERYRDLGNPWFLIADGVDNVRERVADVIGCPMKYVDAGQKHVDGYGAERVAKKILSEFKRGSR